VVRRGEGDGDRDGGRGGHGGGCCAGLCCGGKARRRMGKVGGKVRGGGWRGEEGAAAAAVPALGPAGKADVTGSGVGCGL
jgi:hypothetical protein